jgi:hypothetical protein
MPTGRANRMGGTMTLRVPVSPAVLTWAVERSGSNRNEIVDTFPKFDEWIAGDLKPTLRQVEKLASTAGVPLGYLFLPSPPELELPIPDFREGYGGMRGEPSSDLLAVLHQSIRRQDWYRDYAVDNGLPEVDLVGIAANWSAKRTAGDMRERLAFEVRQRRGNSQDIRKHLLLTFEELGGLTVATSMVGNNTKRLLDSDEFRGFALVDRLAPMIFVNTHQTLNGQFFTIAHEAAHVWRGASGISLEDPALEPQSEVEAWCNAVASQFLVPESDLRDTYRAVAPLPLTAQLERLSSVFRCGTLVILQALRRDDLRTFEDFDADYRDELDRLFALPADSRGSGGNFYFNQPFRIGERFSRAIIADALQGHTLMSEAIRLTSLKSLSTFDRYARHLGAV